ncbi:MAG: signal peptidase I [Candidatus Woesebacteria bacterium]
MFLKRLGSFFLDILEVIVFAVAIFLFIYLLLLQPHKIRGASMEPNFPNGEYLLTDKVSYRFREPERGDVVVFESPNNNREEFIKRIIALPGETISIKEGDVYVNGSLLKEKYLTDSLRTSAGSFINEGDAITVPDDHYFVLGDNRPFSSDSRAWGFITSDDITGRAWLIYWPPQNMGATEKAEYEFLQI